MELRVKDAAAFREILGSLTRFIRRASIEVSDSGFRLRSIDPHDFCYVDVELLPEFFESFEPHGNFQMDFDFSKVSRIVPHLTAGKYVELALEPEGMELRAPGKWDSTFVISPDTSPAKSMERPKQFKYGARVKVNGHDFVKEIKKAAAVSHEVLLEVKGGTVVMSAQTGGYSFNTKPLTGKAIQPLPRVDGGASGHIIVDYVKQLGSLIERAEFVILDLSEDAPLRLNFVVKTWGNFTFYVSHRKLDGATKTSGTKTGDSLPRISMTRFPEYCAFLAAENGRIRQKDMVLQQVETQGGDYTRLARKLRYARSKNRGVSLTDKGRQFVDLSRSDSDAAKEFLHRSALKVLPQYGMLVELLGRRPMPSEEIFRTINAKITKRRKRPLDQQDLSTLLGIATWCGAVDRKLGLYYFGRRAE